MKTPVKSAVLLIISTVFLITLSTSCRTVRGFGQDVEHTGDHIKNAAAH